MANNTMEACLIVDDYAHKSWIVLSKTRQSSENSEVFLRRLNGRLGRRSIRDSQLIQSAQPLRIAKPSGEVIACERAGALIVAAPDLKPASHPADLVRIQPTLVPY